MHPTLVILAVGLTARLIGAHTPHLRGLAAGADGATSRPCCRR